MIVQDPKLRAFFEKVKDATPEATATLEQILRLAGAAPIPVCGQFLTVAADVVKLVNVSPERC